MASACGGDPEPTYEPRPVEAVLLISIDTTRADHLSTYRPEMGTTPRIDALARDSVVFRRAIASNSITLASHSTLLTGTNPPRHGVHDNDSFKLADFNQTLAEALKPRGFETGAVVGSMVLDARFGLDQGFDHYDDDLGDALEAHDFEFVERPADAVADRAIEFIDQRRDGGFFLFVHFYDPHHEWKPPEPYATRFQKNPYAGEIAFVDAQVGRLLDRLKVLGLYDSTLVIITSDHGESLGAHGEPTHGFYVYDVTQHVPLIVKPPGMKGRRDVEEVVGLVDVMPTVLALLGIEGGEALDGLDLSGSFAGSPVGRADRGIYSEAYLPTKLDCNPVFALTSDPWKYIHTRDPELYDLEADPRERANLLADRPEIAERLREQLERDRVRRTPLGESYLDIDAATRAGLERLGYIYTPIDDSAAIDPRRDDAKDCHALWEELGEVIRARQEGKPARAREYARKVLARRPAMGAVYAQLGRIAHDERKWKESISHFRLYLALEGDRSSDRREGGPSVYSKRQLAEAWGFIGFAHRRLGDPDAAREAYRRALELDPDLVEVHHELGELMLELGEREAATAHFEAALHVDPEHESSRVHLSRLRSPL